MASADLKAVRAMQHDSLPKDSDDLKASRPKQVSTAIASPASSTTESELSSFSAEDERLSTMAAACKTILEVCLERKSLLSACHDSVAS